MSKKNKKISTDLVLSESDNLTISESKNKKKSFKEIQITAWISQMLPVARLQYKNEPLKFSKYDMDKNTDYFMENPMVRIQMAFHGIERSDVKGMLECIQKIVLNENAITVESVMVKELEVSNEELR